jgi:hypothetical protein
MYIIDNTVLTLSFVISLITLVILELLVLSNSLYSYSSYDQVVYEVCIVLKLRSCDSITQF